MRGRASEEKRELAVRHLFNKVHGYKRVLINLELEYRSSSEWECIWIPNLSLMRWYDLWSAQTLVDCGFVAIIFWWQRISWLATYDNGICFIRISRLIIELRSYRESISTELNNISILIIEKFQWYLIEINYVKLKKFI